ncbi:MAG TPA: cytochrome c, partial [Pyrinomonadaceae bacterium]|nr:cytochrome c [Pyrinomonadaceae bacterium]
MKPLKLIVVVGFLTMLAAGCTNEGNSNVVSLTTSSSPAAVATATPDEFAATRVVFKEHCSKCHGDSGDGGPVTV